MQNQFSINIYVNFNRISPIMSKMVGGAGGWINIRTISIDSMVNVNNTNIIFNLNYILVYWWWIWYVLQQHLHMYSFEKAFYEIHKWKTEFPLSQNGWTNILNYSFCGSKHRLYFTIRIIIYNVGIWWLWNIHHIMGLILCIHYIHIISLWHRTR